MDFTNILQYSGISASVTAILFVVYKAVQACINRRLRSDCGFCDWSFGVGVSAMTPDYHKPKEEEKTKPLIEPK